MAIRVTCPGCHKRFQVSDKFAGKSGPCPQCKTVIRVPTKDEEVKIKGPEGYGAGVRGAVTTKLIFREEVKFDPIKAVSIALGALAVLIVTALLGRADFFATGAVLKSAVSLLVVSPFLVIAGYWFLRDEEDLDRFGPQGFMMRTAICSVLYMALWGLYSLYLHAVAKGHAPDEIFVLFILLGVFLWAGGWGARLAFDVDLGKGVFHYCFYLFVTAILRWLAGMGWVWETPSVPEPWEVPQAASTILAGSCLAGSPRVRAAAARFARRLRPRALAKRPRRRPPADERS